MTTTKPNIAYAGLVSKNGIGYFDFHWIEGSTDENSKWVNVVYTSKSQVKNYDTKMQVANEKHRTDVASHL